MARVFISYKRNVEPDSSLSQALLGPIQADNHEVFIDRTLTVGDAWAREIETMVRRSDFLIVLLSDAAAGSEMVKGEIQIARDQQSKSGNLPRILPVRVAFAGSLPYPLNAWLDPVQYAMWRTAADTARIVDELRSVISGVKSNLPSAPNWTGPAGATPSHSARVPLPRDVPPPGGTLDVSDPWYIGRREDDLAIGLIQETGGRTISLQGARQMGKSSLMVRLLHTALQQDRHAVVIDLQVFGSSRESSPHTFFRAFVVAIADQLDLPGPADWDMNNPPPLNATRFLGQVLKRLDKPIALAIDETDLLFNTPIQNDFFGMLRHWHNNRAIPGMSHWKKLDLVLVTSTEPYLFITDRQQSPFNVSKSFEMADFTSAQVAECNARHGSPLLEDEVSRLFELLHGHPYLTRRALYLVSGKDPQMHPSDMLASAPDESGPFGDHLRHHLLNILHVPDLVSAFRDIVLRRGAIDKHLFERLRGAGLVRWDERSDAVPRCKLYEIYFGRQFHA